MRTIFFAFALILSLRATAQVNVYPQIFNLGHSIQLQIQNTTNQNIYCTGPIYLNTQQGHMETSFYSDIIRKGGYSTRFFYLINFNDRVSFASHSIFCQKSK